MEEKTFSRAVFKGLQVVDAATIHGTGAPDQAVHFIALFQEQFREVGAVLASDTGDKGFFLHVSFLSSESTSRATMSANGTVLCQPRMRLALAGLPQGATGS